MTHAFGWSRPLPQRPARSAFEYDANSNLLHAGCAHLITGLPLEEAVTSSAALLDTFPEQAAPLAASPAGCYRWDADKRILTQTIGDFERGLLACGPLGAVLLPAGLDAPYFDPDAYALPAVREAAAYDDGETEATAMAVAIDPAFAPEALTAGFLVAVGGRIVAERYAERAGRDTLLAGWSMGKSLCALAVGVLAREGRFSLDEPAPVPDWHAEPGDPRGEITLAHLLRMSGGLRSSGYRDPPHLWGRGSPDHLLPYREAINSYAFATQSAPGVAPGTSGRYRNVDIAAAATCARDAVVADGGNFYGWLRENLFGPAGAAGMVCCPDAFGNPLFTGANYGSARMWAGLGELCRRRGAVGGRQLVDESFFEFAATPSPAWADLDGPGCESRVSGRLFGGGFWTNRPVEGRSQFALPEDAYLMLGGGGQIVAVVPSLDAVMVRLGHYRGRNPEKHTNAAFGQVTRELLRARAGGRRRAP